MKPPVCLIICEDPSLQKQHIEQYVAGVRCLRVETFCQFMQEAFSMSLVESKIAIHLPSVELLKKEEMASLLSYLKKPSPHILLCLTAKSLTGPLIKAVDAVGTTLKVTAEKPWERASRLTNLLVSKAAAAAVCFPPTVATKFVAHFEADYDLCSNELEKLICYVGMRREITDSDLREVLSPYPHETIWQISDAILAKDFILAYRCMKTLLEKELNLFALLASLRTQSETASKILSLYKKGGYSAVSQSFGYLKGKLLERKVALCRQYGESGLKTLRTLLFESELEARDGNPDPEAILEKLLCKATK